MGHRRLGQHKADETLEGHFRPLDFRKIPHRLYHAHDKKQHQQGVADGLEATVDAEDHRPYAAALEILRAGGEERPDFRQLPVPGGQGGVEVVNDPVSTSYYSHLLCEMIKGVAVFLTIPQ